MREVWAQSIFMAGVLWLTCGGLFSWWIAAWLPQQGWSGRFDKGAFARFDPEVQSLLDSGDYEHAVNALSEGEKQQFIEHGWLQRVGTGIRSRNILLGVFWTAMHWFLCWFAVHDLLMSSKDMGVMGEWAYLLLFITPIVAIVARRSREHKDEFTSQAKRVLEARGQ